MCAVSGTQPIVYYGRWQYSDQRYQLRGIGNGKCVLSGHLREAIIQIASKKLLITEGAICLMPS